MISVELWRARIGLFNSKRHSAADFLSSLFSSHVPFKFHRRRKRNAAQEPPPTATCASPDDHLAIASSRPAVTQEEPPHTASHSTSSTRLPAVLQEEPPPTSACSTDLSSTLSPDPSAVKQFFVTFYTFFWFSFFPTSFRIRPICNLLSTRLSGCLLREALVRLILLIAIISQILITSGDVETNPGPGNHPNLPDLMTHVAGKTPTKWYEVGIQLNIEISTLDAFEEQTKNQKRLYSKVFDQWKKEKKLPYTWDTIVNALEKVEENETVIAIKKWLRGAGQPSAAGTSSGSEQPQLRLETAKRKRSHPETDKTPSVVEKRIKRSKGQSRPLARISGSSTMQNQPQVADQLPEAAGSSSSIGGSILPHDQYRFQLETATVKPHTKPFAYVKTRVDGSQATFARRMINEEEHDQRSQKRKLEAVQCKMTAFLHQQQRKLNKPQKASRGSDEQASFTGDDDLDPLQNFNAYLKKVYLQKTIRLSYFEELSLDRKYDPKEDSFSLLLHTGRNSSLVKMTDIGKCTKDSTKLADTILVEGAPGVGKSTFALQMCQKWASGELLQDWSIVILIQLHDRDIREAKTLSEFIYYPDQKEKKEICRELNASNGNGVLFVFDGIDQLNEQPTKGSVYQKLVARQRLCRATLLHLSKSDNQHNSRFDQHIEILGFTEECVNDCITSASGNDAKLLATLTSCRSHPVFSSLMSIPAQCTIITDLYCLHWKHARDEGFSPCTRTELYTDLVCILLLRYLDNSTNYSQEEPIVIEKFADLPKEVYDQFIALAQKAAEGLTKGVYVFDIAPDKTLGLMQRVEEVYPGSKHSKSYSFLNLTLQEYLAAYYCSLLKPAERLGAVFKTEGIIQLSLRLRSLNAIQPNHLNVIDFTVGLTKLSWDVQLFSKCLETSGICLPLMRFLYESQSSDLICLTFLFQNNPASKMDKYGLLEIPFPGTPLDFFAVGYCLPHSNRSWLLNTTKSDFKDEHFEALSKGLNMSSDQCSSIGHIMVMEVMAEQIPLLHMLHPHTQKLTELSIGIPEDSDEVCTDFPVFYPLLKTLKVTTGNFSKSFISLLENLPSMRSLKMLCIELLMISEVADAALKQLRKCRTLQHLEIKREASAVIYTGRSNSCCIPSFVISSKLESLSISCFALTSDPFTQKVISLKTLKLCSCEIPDVACIALICFLQSRHCVLETIEIFDPHVQNSIPDELSEGIGSSRTLKHCVLDRCGSSRKDRHGSIVRHLVAGMKKSKSHSCLEELTVICSSYCPEYDSKDFDELIRVANEHNTISLLKLDNYFEEFVQNHDIRSNLTIHTNCSYTSS